MWFYISEAEYLIRMQFFKKADPEICSYTHNFAQLEGFKNT